MRTNHSLPRRNFLFRLTVLGGVSLLAPLSVRSLAPPSSRRGPQGRRITLDTASREDFVNTVGTEFRIQPPVGEALPAKLRETTALNSQSGGMNQPGRRKPFALLFELPSGATFTQNTCRISHGELGAMDLFLVPVGPAGDRLHCEAVFA